MHPPQFPRIPPLYRSYTALLHAAAMTGSLTDLARRAQPATLLRLFLGILLPLTVLGLIGEDVLEKERFAFETPAMLWLHGHAGGALTGLSVFMNYFGGPLVMGVVIVLLPTIFWFTRHRPQALFALLALGGAAGVQAIMKRIFQRPRPELWPRLVTETGASFPSGHSTVAAALAVLVVLLLWPTRLRWPALVLGAGYYALMALSRVVLGVHYPTDVLAGGLTSLVWVLGTYQILRGRLLPQHAGRA
ncbi:phosphatidylglycerophosphatase B (plasmid) [Deinococcus aetherius]|uniref:Phosphatidylglycerophosphatase B n=2 Tax=Deinococcus aetherius TaxID=200252 RepID=A0ABM8ALB2_9DEIO|nr:phosphatidylglycerophosphatase B [Deinococcus aetherius]